MDAIFNSRLAHIPLGDQSAIQKIVSCFVETLHPLAVYLFGSFAENRANKDSDFDFYIVVDDKVKDSNLDLICQSRLSIWDCANRPCDVIVDKLSYFNKAKKIRNSLEYDVQKKV